MSKPFNEYDATATAILDIIEAVMLWVRVMYDINYINPPHDIARRFLNEIYEFEPLNKADEAKGG